MRRSGTRADGGGENGISREKANSRAPKKRICKLTGKQKDEGSVAKKRTNQNCALDLIDYAL